PPPSARSESCLERHVSKSDVPSLAPLASAQLPPRLATRDALRGADEGFLEVARVQMIVSVFLVLDRRRLLARAESDAAHRVVAVRVAGVELAVKVQIEDRVRMTPAIGNVDIHQESASRARARIAGIWDEGREPHTLLRRARRERRRADDALALGGAVDQIQIPALVRRR